VTTLAFDTATPRPSLAVVQDGSTRAELDLGPVEGGGRRVLEAVHAVLGHAGMGIEDVDRIVVGVGPGGFTGIRIGVATALGLGHALGIPVTGASSLEALALGLARRRPDAELLAPAIDARRSEVFGAVYRISDGLEELVAPHAAPAASFAATAARHGADVAFAGTGVLVYGEAFGRGDGAVRDEDAADYPQALDLVARVDAGGGLPARPVYCRLPDAEEKRLARARGGS
jgi:tRNA threonylcarbamoyl adenosine modification protein YeaZ